MYGSVAALVLPSIKNPHISSRAGPACPGRLRLIWRICGEDFSAKSKSARLFWRPHVWRCGCSLVLPAIKDPPISYCAGSACPRRLLLIWSPRGKPISLSYFSLRARECATFCALHVSHSRQRLHGFSDIRQRVQDLLCQFQSAGGRLAVLGEGFQVKGYQAIIGNARRCTTFWRLHLWPCGCSGSLSRPGAGEGVLGECS